MAPKQDEVISKIIKSIVALSKEALDKKKASPSPLKELNSEKTEIVFESPLAAIEREKESQSAALKSMFQSGIPSRVPVFEIRDTLAAFMIRAIVLDPKYNFNIEREMNNTEVVRLIETCVAKIISEGDLEMETIKMQVYFDTNFPSQAEFLNLEKRRRMENCTNVLREIMEVKTKSIANFESLNRKIVVYILQRSNCGEISNIEVIKEATAALESVFPNSELSAFISLSRADKEAQLNGLANLVTGIRLFNKHLGKGGQMIDNLPELASKEFREFSLLVKEQTEKTEDSIQLYKALLDYAVKNPQSEVTPGHVEIFTQGLVFQRQYLLYLDALQEQVDQSKLILDTISNKFDEALRELQFVCKAKSAVPVDQVYPLFISLATLWYSWFEQLFLLAYRRGIIDTLKTYASFALPITDLMMTLCHDLRTDIELENQSESEIIQNATTLMKNLLTVNDKVDIIHPGNTTNYYKLLVEFGGFCPVTLIKRRGLPLPGDMNIGLIRYKDRLFCCSDLAHAIEFCKKPDEYIDSIVKMSLSKPCYVQLLHLYKLFPSVDTLDRAQSFSRQQVLGQLPIVSEIACQVDTHIQESNIVRNYKWNEWDLRRNALMLVNLKNKKTHSAQTDLSHYRRESETQHYVQKCNYTQTKRSSNTSVPKTVHYLAGIRNGAVPMPRTLYQDPSRRDYHFRVYDMTIDQDGGPVPYGGGAYGLPPLVKAPVKVEKGV